MPVGSYSISLIPGNGTEYIGETNTFGVVDRDVTELEIKAARGATLTGRIALEGADDKAILAVLSQAHLQLVIRSENGFPIANELALSPDGSFRATGVAAGTVRVIFNRQWNDDDKFSILRIERDGIDQPRGLMVKTGEQITGLRIVIGYGTGSLRGTVKVENGSTSSTVYIYVQLFT